MAVIVQDNFNRANSTSVVGAPQIGPSPVVTTGTLGISSNRLYTSSLGTNGSIVTWECSTPNVDITVKRAGVVTSGGIALGVVGALETWYAFFDGNTSGSIESYLGKFNGSSGSITQILKGRGGPSYITDASILRVIHYNGWVEMWSDSNLILRGFLPETLSGTKHGIRITATNTQNFDDLTISDAPDITIPVKTGEVREPDFGTHSTTSKDSFVYRGRDTKAQDTTGVS